MTVRSTRKGKYPDYEKRRRIKNRIIALGTALFFILGLCRDGANVRKYTNIDGAGYTFHFPDLGQGDCTVIMSENECVVIDTGPYDSRYMCGHYIDKLTDEVDLLIFTHPHDDHIGGFEEVIERTSVRCIMIPDIRETNSQYERYLSLAEKAGIKVIRAVPGTVYTVGEIRLHILAPLYEDGEDANNSSMVVKAETGEVSALVTGDIGHAVEEKLIDTYGSEILNSDILKVPHHGSSGSSSAEFLKAVSPTYAVISCDKYNSYGHPAWQTEKRLKEAGIEYFTTAECGSIVIVSDGKDVELYQ